MKRYLILVLFLMSCSLEPKEKFAKKIEGNYTTGNVGTWFASQLSITGVPTNLPVVIDSAGSFTISGARFTIETIRDPNLLWAVYKIETSATPPKVQYTAISVATLTSYAVEKGVYPLEKNVPLPIEGVSPFLIRRQ